MESGLHINNDIAQGEVTHGDLTVDGARLTGWVELLAEGRSPMQIVVAGSGAEASRLILPSSGPMERMTFEVTVDRKFFRHPLLIDLKVFVADATGSGSELPMTGTAGELTLVKVGSGSDLMRLVQSPIERLKNPNLLFYISYHAFDRFPNDFGPQAAMLCTMGYRLLEGMAVPDAAIQKFWDRVHNLLKVRPALPHAPRGLWLRWHTSVRLVAGYLAFRNKDTVAAGNYFNGIGDFAFDLAHWPSSLTNVLIGIFLAGWMHYERGEFPEAAQTWRRAEGVLRYGGATALLTNFYAYGELGNAVKVAQETFVGLLQAENGGKPLNDPRLVPAGYEFDIRHLPGLRHNLGIT